MTRTLQRGDYLIEAREHEIDVHVTVDAGGTRTELEDSVPRHGAIYQVVSLSSAGRVAGQLRSADHRTKQGRVSVAHRALACAHRDERAGELRTRLRCVRRGRRADRALATTRKSLDARRRQAARSRGALRGGGRRGRCAHRRRIRWPTCSTAARDQWAAAVRATEIATDAYESADDEAGVHNAATLRAAAEIELAGAMNAGTQRAEQRALYANADRRLAEAADFFKSHAMPVRAQYATNMRAVLAVSIG